MLDVEQIKRVFVNLIDNALDALLHEDNPKQITIVTRHDARAKSVDSRRVRQWTRN
jgi:nitrogen-specific signal transduction histidine kinase